MIRRTTHRPPRRGAVLLVVLGLLALFAVVGLGFVLYAESEATGARNYRSSRNEIADPDPATAANAFLGQLLFGTNDTTSAAFGVDMARSRFGVAGFQSPFTGTGVPAEALTLNGRDNSGAALPGLALDRRQVVRFAAAGGWDSVSPDFMLDNVTRINKAVPYTYPDRNNFWLAYYDPVSDTVTLPSFHRPDLFGPLAPTNVKWRNNGHPSGGDSTGFYQTLRPRQGEHPNFPLVPANADGSFTGDVPNLRWLTGSVKNDSLWMDLGLPVRTWRGKQYKMLVAPLILDLGGRVNLSVAGNNRGVGGIHGSHHGWGAWEVNPTSLLGGGATDLAALMNLRYTGQNPVAPAPTSLDRFRNLSTGTLNRGLMPPQYARLDASGTGTGAADPMTLPAAGGFYPFPWYSSRFAASQSNVAVPPTLDSQLGVNPGVFHPQSFSPSQWPRRQTPQANSPWVPGADDQMRLLLRAGGPKGNSGYNGQFTPNNKLTTLFSVSQRWGEVTVLTGPGTTAKLAAIDISRPLAEYRRNPLLPPSPVNNYNPTVAADAPFYQAARLARQNLARDIFVRLAAVNNQVDGTNVAYSPTTGYLSVGAGTPPATVAGLRFWAQVSVNMVDQIDNDDVATTFVWNPTAVSFTNSPLDPAADLSNFAAAQIPLSVAYGTELPKLVLNEAYCLLNNSRRDSNDPPNAGPPVMAGKKPNRDNLLKRYWIELHNPLATDPTLADGGAARLRYDPATTALIDPTNPANTVPAPFAASVYQIEIAEVPAGMGGAPVQPYSAYLAANPVAGIQNYAISPVPGMTHKIVLNDYTPYSPQPMGGAAMAADTTNVVPPANGVAGPAGYFVIGPQDVFPTPGVANNLCVADPPAMAAAPVNSLSYDTGTRKPTGNAMGNDPTTTTSVILLRRLANPYLPAQIDPTQPNYNPYMTVDYLENVPTRDRARYDDTDDRTVNMWMASTQPTVGRRHPYAAAPAYNPAAMAAPFPAVVDQVNAAVMANPPHTLGAANGPIDNAAGLAWLAHLDREPVNALEVLYSSVWSADQLTQKFYNGTTYQGHTHPLQTGTPALIDSATYPTAFRALDLLGVANRLPGIPLGGREPGRINVNSAMDNAAASDGTVLQAALDPQSGNYFNAAFVGAAWGTVLPTRTPGNNGSGSFNLPAATAAEGGTDRPFQPLTSFQDTLFRQGAVPNYPAYFNAAGGTHHYTQSEPLRKGWNNLTTVSDGFLVVFTVGFFEVNGAGQLGKELYDKVNGDLRAQYAGIIDRSAITLTIDPNTLAVQTPNLAVNPVTPAALGPKPWETKLAADSLPGSNQITVQALCPAGSTTCTVFDDGTAVTIDPTVTTPTATRVRDLWVGYAMANPSTAGFATNVYPAGTADGDGEAVRVTAVTPGAVAGTAVLTVTPAGGGALRRFHGGGSRVSNAPVGHPGPQPSFDYRDTSGKYRGVLPYFMRIVP